MSSRVFADVTGPRPTRCNECGCRLAAFTPVFGVESAPRSGAFRLVCTECGLAELERRASAARAERGIARA